MKTDLLKIKDVLAIVPIGRSTLYTLIAKGEFPEPKRIGRYIYWPRNIIKKWYESNGFEVQNDI